VIVGLIVVGLAFVGVIFLIRWWVARLENGQPSGDSDSSFAMWSQDVYDGPGAVSSSIGMAVASDWEREASRDAPDQNDANASDMGSLDSDSRIETDSFSSDNSSSDFSDSSDMGGLDN
jgi:hypothetical protein